MIDCRDWTDITVPLKTGMVGYPGDPSVQIERIQNISQGDSCTVSRISMTVHAGTHVDAPLHFLEKGPSIDQVPTASIIGQARVIAVGDQESITVAELETSPINKGEIVLFKTSNSLLWQCNSFSKDHVYLSTPAAFYLADKGISTVGIDYLSIGGFNNNNDEVHKILLNASIWIIESLDLSTVSPGLYDFICLPLRINGCEAAPARALIKPI